MYRYLPPDRHKSGVLFFLPLLAGVSGCRSGGAGCQYPDRKQHCLFCRWYFWMQLSMEHICAEGAGKEGGAGVVPQKSQAEEVKQAFNAPVADIRARLGGGLVQT